MGKVTDLTADDIEIGMEITIFDSKETPSPIPGMVFPKNREFFGDILRVLSINCPFIAVQFQTGPYAGQTWPLDLRFYKLMKVSEEYSLAMRTPNPLQQARIEESQKILEKLFPKGNAGGIFNPPHNPPKYEGLDLKDIPPEKPPENPPENPPETKV